jgi:hypothetical protein
MSGLQIMMTATALLIIMCVLTSGRVLFARRKPDFSVSSVSFLNIRGSVTHVDRDCFVC